MKKKMVAIMFLLPLIFNFFIFRVAEVISEGVMIPVSGISLNTNQLDFFRLNGMPQTLIANVYPARATNPQVFWESSDTTIATVDRYRGIVSPVNNGFATITATSIDGGFSRDAIVRVESQHLESFDLTVWQGSTQVTGNLIQIAQNQSLTLRAEISSVNAIDEQETRPRIQTNQPSSERQRVQLQAFGNATHGMMANGRHTLVFETTVSALVRGIVDVVVTIPERMPLSDGQSNTAIVRLNVVSPYTDDITLEANGIHVSSGGHFRTTEEVVNLETNRVGATLAIRPEDEAIATLSGYTLIFNFAGQVRLSFQHGYHGDIDSGYVYITSSLGVLTKQDIPTLYQLEQEGMQIFAGTTERIILNIQEFLQFYNFVPTIKNATADMHASFANNELSIVVGENVSQETETLLLTFTGIPYSPVTHVVVKFEIDLAIVQPGPTMLEFNLNMQTSLTNNFERRYVFGNKAANRGDFVFGLETTTMGGRNSEINFAIQTDFAGLATIEGSNIVFNSNFDFSPFAQYKDDGYARVVVTATARHPAQATGVRAQATYIFEIAPNAVNVRNHAEFLIATNTNLTNCVVLHTNIAVTSTTIFRRSLYGNGFRLDGTAVSNSVNDVDTPIFEFIRHHLSRVDFEIPAIVTNVRFLGNDMIFQQGVNALPNLMNHGSLLRVAANTTVRYSRMEGATIILNIPAVREIYRTNNFPNENVVIENSFIAFGALTGAWLGSGNSEWERIGDVTFRDVHFEHCLAGIVFDVNDEHGARPRTFTRLKLEGSVRFNTWLDRDFARSLSLRIDEIEVRMSMIRNLISYRNPLTDREFQNLAIAVPFSRGTGLIPPPINFDSRAELSLARSFLNDRFYDRSHYASNANATHLISPPSNINLAHFSPRATLGNGQPNPDFMSAQQWLESLNQPENVRLAFLFRST